MSAKQRTELMELHANVIMENYGRDERKHFMFEMEDTYTKKDDFLCALENHAYYSILVLVCMGRKRQLAKMVEEFWVEYQEANKEYEESDDDDSDDDDSDDDDETIVECKGCKNWIDNKTGFCSEGCNYAEIAGVWYCERCSGRCEDCEFCPNCGKEEITTLGESERKTFYPKQILDADGLCSCANCLDCNPSLFRGMTKPRQCVVCDCYNLRDIKIVEEKIYCLDCAPEPVCNPAIDEFWKDFEEKIENKEVCADCHENMDSCTCKDFATEWNKEMTLDERVALLSKTFDNKEEEIAIASVWLMSPDNKNIQQAKYDFSLYSKFRKGHFECRQFLIDDIMDYYVVFFDAEDGGVYNESAKWIAPSCGVLPTGNFIVMRKKWIDGKEHTVEMDISPKDFKNKYLNK
jgi:hypothetical protein